MPDTNPAPTPTTAPPSSEPDSKPVEVPEPFREVVMDPEKICEGQKVEIVRKVAPFLP